MKSHLRGQTDQIAVIGGRGIGSVVNVKLTFTGLGLSPPHYFSTTVTAVTMNCGARHTEETRESRGYL